jgi:hypothetical protein
MTRVRELSVIARPPDRFGLTFIIIVINSTTAAITEMINVPLIVFSSRSRILSHRRTSQTIPTAKNITINAKKVATPQMIARPNYF